MKHGPSARGTEAERRGDCRSAATGPIILAEHDLFRARVGKSRIRNSLGGNGEGVIYAFADVDLKIFGSTFEQNDASDNVSAAVFDLF